MGAIEAMAASYCFGCCRCHPCNRFHRYYRKLKAPSDSQFALGSEAGFDCGDAFGEHSEALTHIVG